MIPEGFNLSLIFKSLREGHSFFGGAMIVAGTTIGAGMFSLPVVAAGMWTLWAFAALFFTWFCLFHSGLMILETNLNYPEGAGFSTMVNDLLGQHWNRLNNLAFAFVGYILAYAYISGGSGIVVQTTHAITGYSLSLKVAGTLFSLGLALFVWWSTRAVDRLSVIMLGGMVVTYFASVNPLAVNINLDYLLDSGGTIPSFSYFPYLFAALPFFLTSFGFHSNVPSLMKYYGKAPGKIIASLLTGTLLALFLYILWLVSIQGNLPRHAFSAIITQGGNIDILLSALSHIAESQTVAGVLSVFAHLAVASSFLGVTLGLFDFISDLLNLDNSRLGRTKTAVLTFIPPMLGGVLFPDGFLVAIGLAGLAATLWVAIIPALMVRKSRQKFSSPHFKVWGGDMLTFLVIGYGLLTIVCYLLNLFRWLPVFQ